MSLKYKASEDLLSVLKHHWLVFFFQTFWQLIRLSLSHNEEYSFMLIRGCYQLAFVTIYLIIKYVIGLLQNFMSLFKIFFYLKEWEVAAMLP